MFYATTYASPVGNYRIITDGTAISGIWREGQSGYLTAGEFISKGQTKNALLTLTTDWLERYFQKQKPAIAELPLVLNGTDFQKTVWQLLIQIPYGEVTTYGALAKEVAIIRHKQRMSAQAVGGAVGKNPLSIVVPCHRVIGAQGNLTGYGGGIDTKIKLLQLEGSFADNFFLPKT